MARPHTAALIEDAWNAQLAGVMRRRGWGTRVLPFTGYGSTTTLRVLGRVLMTRRPYAPAAADAGATWLELRNADNERRGWRSFFTTPAIGEPVTVHVGDREVRTRSDRSGIIDLTVTDHGLSPGWHDLRIESPRAAETSASVFVVAPETTFGIVSDIDDTVLTTAMPRPFIAAYNILSAIFRGLGDSRSPMYVIGVACAINIALDFLFIGRMGLGPVGAALGTVIAQTASVALALVWLKSRRTNIHVKRSDLRPQPEVLGSILKIGVPVAVQDGCIQVAFMFITVIANHRGLVDAAAVGLVEKMISFLFIVPSSTGATVSALTA